MNLSSYLQMPPAPSVPSSSPSLMPQGARTAASPSAAGNMGFDFAQVMARQIQRLVPQERQDLAADAPEAPEIPEKRTDTRDSTPSRSADDDRHSERSDASTRSASRPARESLDDQPHTPARQRVRAAAAKAAPVDAASLLEGMTPVLPLATTPTATPLESETAPLLATPTPLQTIQLSPQVRIITTPQQAPSPESLAAFAKSMGLDESAIQNLLGQTATTANTPAGTALNPSSGLSPTPAATLPTALGTAQPSGMPAMDGSLTSAPMTAMVANAAPVELTVSGAGLALSASTLNAPTAPGLSAADMAAIQQVQITVLPAATLPNNASAVNAPVPSTLDMLSLLGEGVDERDVSALLTRFSEDAGNEGQAEHHESPNEGQPFSSFAQTLARNNATHATTPSAQATAPNMSEVYDQLSDKMATEMAARMHKQLSDGEWKMKFGLRPAHLGGVEIQLEMKDGKLDAVFHADNPLTRDLLQNSSQRLRDALGNFGINAGQVQVGQGGGNAQQNASGNTGKRTQVRDNSSSQVNGTEHASSVSATRNKANASLLDLYA